MAHCLGAPIVSSNWFIIDKPNCVFLPSSEETSTCKIPSSQTITDGIVTALTMNKCASQLEQYKLKFIDNMNQLFG